LLNFFRDAMAHLYQNSLFMLLLLGLAACGKPPADAPDAALPMPAKAANHLPVKAAVEPSKAAIVAVPQKKLIIPVVQADSLKTAIANAESALAQGKLEGLNSQTPAAMEWYLAVLSFAPEHPQAVQGLQTVFNTLLETGLLAQRQGSLNQAQHIAEVIKLSQRSFPEANVFLQQMPAVLNADAVYQKGKRFEASKQIFFDVKQDKNLTAVGAYQAALTEWPQFGPAITALSRLRVEQQQLAKKYAAASNFDQALLALEKAGQADAKQLDYLNTVLLVRSQLHQQLSYQTSLAHLALDGLRVSPAQLHYENARKLSPTDVSVKQLAQRIDDVKHYGRFEAGKIFTDAWVMSNPAPEMVVIPYGRFQMGNDPQKTTNKAETPMHSVTFARGFAIARHEVTVAQFKEFIDNTNYVTRADKRGYSIVFDEKGGSLMQKEKINWRHDHLGRIADMALPVVHVSLHDAQAYASWLSGKTNQRYRLPSEAEYEYVQAAGATTLYSWGDESPRNSTANLAGAGDKSTHSRSFGNAIEGYRDFYWGAAPVRSFPREAWGTFDITGNVAEWVEDCWHVSYLRAPGDGTAWVNPGCEEGVVRGGSWGSALEQARIRFRMTASRKDHTAQIGFRVARSL
jgi:formylglycine-generating enzyme required for sulfatase activity